MEMDNDSAETSSRREPALPISDGRVVYVMPANAIAGDGSDDIDLTELWKILWWGKWLIVGITTIAAIWSIVYALGLTNSYRAEVLLAPAQGRSVPQGVVGQLGSLAGLAGISVGGGGSVEPLAILRSRDFTRSFIEDQKLMPILYADRWDAQAGRWTEEDPELWPDIRNGVSYFNSNVLRIEEDNGTGLITVSIEWSDRELAAQWANLLVKRLNDHMRLRALREAQANLEYLQAELAETSVVALQQSIGRLLEQEMQKLMLARGNEEFAFRIIDPAEVPIRASGPNRRLIVMAATAAGGVLSVILVLGIHFIRSRMPKKVEPAQESSAE